MVATLSDELRAPPAPEAAALGLEASAVVSGSSGAVASADKPSAPETADWEPTASAAVRSFPEVDASVVKPLR